MSREPVSVCCKAEIVVREGYFITCGKCGEYLTTADVIETNDGNRCENTSKQGLRCALPAGHKGEHNALFEYPRVRP